MSEHYHFIGIGGIGMSGLARLLLSKNIFVSGSDVAINYTIEGLIQAGAVIYKGQAAENISPKMTVVYSSDIKPDNVEYQAALQLQCPLLHRSDLLAQLVHQHRSLAIAGTHGKTTTSSLLATVLVEAGLDPSFAVGGVLPEFQSNSRFGQGELFAFEADESDRTFLKYFPWGAIVTNIDNDHLNNYEGNEEVLIKAFQTFMSQVTSPQHLFWCGDDPYLNLLNMPGQRYGFGEHCEWRVSHVRQQGFQIVFDVEGKGIIYPDITLNLIGHHNALNATAVFALSLSLGISEASIRQTFQRFKGVLRRCENKGKINGVVFIDDYAHHPTEIQTTLKGIRQAIQEKRLIAVFQPHRYSRTQDCLGQYGTIFDSADEVIVTDIYAAGEVPIPGVSPETLMLEIQEASSISCQYVPRAALSHKLSQITRPHSVVVSLGAGDITKVAGETLALLEKQPPCRLKVGIIFDERKASVEALNLFQKIAETLSPVYYQVHDFFITNRGEWLFGAEAKQQMLLRSVEKEAFLSTCSEDILHHLLDCDLILPLSTQSDGALQGFLSLLNKPFVGANQRCLALCNHPYWLKTILRERGVAVPLFLHFSHQEWQQQRKFLLNRLLKHSLPWRLRASSIKSFDVRHIHHSQDLEEMITQALQSSPEVIIEEEMEGQRVELTVVGKESLQVFPRQKYAWNSAFALSAVELAKKVYVFAECCGMADIRLILDGKGKYWFDAIQPFPGFIEAGCSSLTEDLIDKSVSLALR